MVPWLSLSWYAANASNTIEEFMPSISTIRSKDPQNNDVVALILSQDSVSASPDGDPWCGIALSAEQARSLAERLYDFANEIENREEAGFRCSSRFMPHLHTVLVLHDGSHQGHRAFRAALNLAARSLAALDFIGIFGWDPETRQPSTNSNDYLWQQGWLERLIEMYTRDAADDGVTFNAMTLPSDEGLLVHMLEETAFDLLVIPQGLLTKDGAMSTLQPFAAHCKSNVLVCP